MHRGTCGLRSNPNPPSGHRPTLTYDATSGCNQHGASVEPCDNHRRCQSAASNGRRWPLPRRNLAVKKLTRSLFAGQAVRRLADEAMFGLRCLSKVEKYLYPLNGINSSGSALTPDVLAWSLELCNGNAIFFFTGIQCFITADDG